MYYVFLMSSLYLMCLFLSLLSLYKNKLYIFNMLLIIETLMLLMFFLLMINNMHNYFMEIILFLVIMVCESCLGMMIITSVVSFYNTDLIKSNNMLW